MRQLPESQAFALLLLGDISYLLLFILALWPGNDSAAANIAMHGLIFFYWPLPAFLSIGALAACGQLKGNNWRAIRLCAWAIILPIFAFVAVTLATYEGCRLDWLHCQPY